MTEAARQLTTETPASPPVALRIHEPGGVRVVRPAGLPISIGRSLTCDVHLDHPGVSARHATLALDKGGALVLRDAGSTNGTWVDGTRIKERAVGPQLSFVAGEIRVEVIVHEALPRTIEGAPLPASSTAPLRAMLRDVGSFVACYGLLLFARAAQHYGREWPPERPATLATEAAGAMALCIFVGFLLAVFSKLGTKRYQLPRLVAILASLVCFDLVFDAAEPTLTDNLRLPLLRAFLPGLLQALAGIVAVRAFLRAVFPAWSGKRRVHVATVAVGTLVALLMTHGHFTFSESSRRTWDLSLGMPLFDPRVGATTTTTVLDSLDASRAVVDAYRDVDWKEVLTRDSEAMP